MFDPRRSGERTSRATLLAGALVLLVAGAALTYWGIDRRRHGCGCDESLYPSWSWVVLVALAAAAFVTAAMLAGRAMRTRG